MNLNFVRFLIVLSMVLSACTLKVQVSSTLPPLDKLSPSSPSLDLTITSFEKVHYGATSTPEITWIDAQDDDGGSGLSHYEMAVGTIGKLNDIVDWVDVGNGNRASLNVPKLKRGQEYYLSLVAVDHAGNRSAAVTSPAWQAEPLVTDYEPATSNLKLNSPVSRIFKNSSNERFLAGNFSKYNVNHVGVEARVNSNGSIDNQFYGAESYKFFTGVVRDAAYQSVASVDYVVIVGDITQISGQKNRARIYRTKANGDLDASFQAQIGDGFVGIPNDVVITSDNKIIVVGDFISYKGSPVGRIVRLNTDGSLDTSFNVGTGFNAAANSVAVTNSGKIIVGGRFTKVNNVTVPNFIVMLNTNGSVDTTFSTNAGVGFDLYDAYSTVSSVSFSIGGQILVSGRFTSYGGTSGVGCTALLNVDGTLDADYRTNIASKMSCGSISKIWELPDSSYMFSGSIGYYNSVLYKGILKVNKTTGALDSTFVTNLSSDFDSSYLWTAIVDGTKIVLMGYFKSINGDTAYANLARVNLDGSRDTSFNYTSASGFAEYANAGFKGSDGAYHIFGGFRYYGGSATPKLIKLKSDSSVDTDFITSATSILSGMVPELFTSFLDKYFIRVYNSSLAAQNTVCLTGSGSVCSVSAFEARLPEANGMFSDGSALFVVGHPTIDDLVIPIRIDKNNVENASFNTNYDSLGIIDPNFSRNFFVINDKIVMTGDFVDVDGVAISGLYRINIDGTADTAFNSKVGAGLNDGSGPVMGREVYANNNQDLFVSIFADTSLVYNQTPVPSGLKFVKLSFAGDLDLEYLTNAAINLSVTDLTGMTFLPDNRVMIFGNLLVNGQARNLVRLKADGHVDMAFDSITQISDTFVTAVDYDDDDNLIVATSGTMKFKGQVLGTESFFKLRAK